ncbi:MAG: dihydrodipicolinate synthase family protein [Planctomycetales bacterium]|nr:dihydrodipicolinate synthase family protein [Planctomycetales bacterium]
MNSIPRFRGLVAATFTPFTPDGEINLPMVEPLVEHAVATGMAGLYVLGSTGEGLSLTQAERLLVAEQFVRCSAGRVPIIVQVGSESLRSSHELARHAQKIGAHAISAVSPVYFRPENVSTLVASMQVIASGAPELPFYYYHIPGATGVTLNMLEFLKLGSQLIPNLRGLKFTSPAAYDLQACVECDDQRFEILWGVDEMLLSGMVAGAVAAVGSTYNFASRIYHNLIAAQAEGNYQRAAEFQSLSQLLVRTFVPFGPRAAQKAIMSFIGLDCGPSRLPIAPLSDSAREQLREKLDTIGFFQW